MAERIGDRDCTHRPSTKTSDEGKKQRRKKGRERFVWFTIGQTTSEGPCQTQRRDVGPCTSADILGKAPRPWEAKAGVVVSTGTRTEGPASLHLRYFGVFSRPNNGIKRPPL